MRWREKMERKCACLAQEVQEGKGWEAAAHEATLLQTYLFRIQPGRDFIEVEDWLQDGATRKISVDPSQSPEKLLESRFRRARKLKRKLEVGERLLEKTRVEMLSPPPLPTLTKKKNTPPPAKLPYREYTTQSGLKIYVGKKAKDNDRLTFQMARGSDYWFHAANTPGSHVVLSVSKHTPPDEGAIQDALQLALYYSKARGSPDEVIMTQCKNLAKPKRGKAGAVHVSRHKTISVRPSPERLGRLFFKSAL